MDKNERILGENPIFYAGFPVMQQEIEYRQRE
jgi:hypothetical protein